MIPNLLRPCYIWLIPFLLFAIGERSAAQPGGPALQGAFLEAGGAAPHYSVNYTRRVIAAQKMSGYIRIGAGVWGEKLAVPAGIALLFGAGSHHPELLLAITPYSEGLRFWNREDSDLFVDLVLGLGYRYQPAGGAAFIAGGLFPYLHFDPAQGSITEEPAELGFRPGLSVGWFFSRPSTP